MIKFLARLFHSHFTRTVNKIKQFTNRKKPANKPSEPIANLDPATIPKYVNQLTKPPEYKPFVIEKKVKVKGKKGNKKKCINKKVKSHLYFIDISEFKQQILPEGFPGTTVWGYGGLIKDPKTGSAKYSRSAPGATFEAIRYPCYGKVDQ